MENEAEKIIEKIMDAQKLATHSQVADFLGIAASTLHGLITRNSVKTLKKHLRFKNINADIPTSINTIENNDIHKMLEFEVVPTITEENIPLNQAIDMFMHLTKEIKKNENCDKNFKLFCFKKLEEIKNLILIVLNEKNKINDTRDDLDTTSVELVGKLEDGSKVQVQIDETTMLNLIAKAKMLENK